MSEIQSTANAVQTPVSDSTPSVQNSDTDAILFDDLDKSPKSKETKKDILPASAEEALKSKSDAKSKAEPKKSADKEPKKDSKEPEAKKATTQPDKSPESGEEKEKPKVEAKKLKAKYADRAYEFEEDATVSVKIDGKEVEVPIKEIISNYSGKVAWDKRFSELDRERKIYKQMKDASEAKIKSIFEEPDPEIRFYKMAELSGVDPIQVRRKFLEDNIQLLEKWYNMTEDERRADELEYENKLLKLKTEAMAKEQAFKSQKEALAKRVQELMVSHKIDKAEFVSRYDEIETLVEQGKLEEDKLTPEFVAETIVKDRLWSAVEESVNKLQIETTPEKIMKLVELSYQEGLSPQDMGDIVDELWGVKRVRSVIDTKEKERNEFYEGSKETKKQNTGLDIWSFDQI